MQEPPGDLRLYLVDDHPAVRAALARVIASEPGMTVVGRAGTAREAIRDVQSCMPDVVLVDLNLPDLDGIELLRSLRRQIPRAKLVVFSAVVDELHVPEAIGAGAHGYMVKTSSPGEVLDAIRSAATGGTPLSASASAALVRSMHEPSESSGSTIGSLTPRERQVFRLLAVGFATVEVAARLEVSPKTVETLRRHIYQKLGCESHSDLTLIAVRLGLIEA